MLKNKVIVSAETTVSQVMIEAIASESPPIWRAKQRHRLYVSREFFAMR
jgi:hypothetical protein